MNGKEIAARISRLEAERNHYYKTLDRLSNHPNANQVVVEMTEYLILEINKRIGLLRREGRKRVHYG